MSLAERAANMREMALQARADGRGFIGLGKDGFESGVDVAVRNAAVRAVRARCGNVLGGANSRAGGRIRGRSGRRRDIVFAEARDDVEMSFLVLGATFEILAHFVDRMRAAHQGAEGGGVELRLGGKFARRGTGAHGESIAEQRKASKGRGGDASGRSRFRVRTLPKYMLR